MLFLFFFCQSGLKERMQNACNNAILIHLFGYQYYSLNAGFKIFGSSRYHKTTNYHFNFGLNTMHFIEAGAGNCLRICIFIFASIFKQNLVDTLANCNFYFKAPKCVLVQGDFSNISLHLFSLFNIQEKFTLVTKDSPKF